MLNEFQKYTASPEFQELLHRYEKSREENIPCFMEIDDIIDIAEYYHSIDDIKNLDELLADPDMSVISPSDRGDLIQIMVSLGMYDEAFKWTTCKNIRQVYDKSDQSKLACHNRYDSVV